MRVLFIAPRYHTNQSPIVESLLEQGHTVEFLVYRKGIIEDYTCITPRVLKPNLFFRLYFQLYYNDKTYEEKERFMIKYFFPNIRDLISILKHFKPSVVIMREGGYSTMLSTLICRLMLIKKTILYTQTPQYENNKSDSRLIVKIQKRYLLPHISYTPVKTSIFTNDFSHMTKTSKEYIPFVMKFSSTTLNRGYLKGGKINLLDVGKYRDYKNHIILLKALSRLESSVLSAINVTVIGQVTTDSEKEYFNLMKTFISEHDLDNTVTLLESIQHAEMPNMYLSNDVFVLTSKRETASVSILEAMSYGLVCVSTSHNGTATYLGNNGFIFESENVESLVEILYKVVSLKEQLPLMGKATYNYALNNFNYHIYCHALEKLCIKN